MNTRIWLAIAAAPILGAVVYAWLTLASVPATIPERPTPLSLVGSGAIVGLIFEVAIVVPVFLALRRWRHLRATSFVLLTSLAWLAVCYFFMLSLGVGASNASATAVQMLLPGVTLALAFWVLGVAHSGA